MQEKALVAHLELHKKSSKKRLETQLRGPQGPCDRVSGDCHRR